MKSANKIRIQELEALAEAWKTEAHHWQQMYHLSNEALKRLKSEAAFEKLMTTDYGMDDHFPKDDDG